MSLHGVVHTQEGPCHVPAQKRPHLCPHSASLCKGNHTVSPCHVPGEFSRAMSPSHVPTRAPCCVPTPCPHPTFPRKAATPCLHAKGAVPCPHTTSPHEETHVPCPWSHVPTQMRPGRVPTPCPHTVSPRVEEGGSVPCPHAGPCVTTRPPPLPRHRLPADPPPLAPTREGPADPPGAARGAAGAGRVSPRAAAAAGPGPRFPGGGRGAAARGAGGAAAGGRAGSGDRGATAPHGPGLIRPCPAEGVRLMPPGGPGRSESLGGCPRSAHLTWARCLQGAQLTWSECPRGAQLGQVAYSQGAQSTLLSPSLLLGCPGWEPLRC